MSCAAKPGVLSRPVITRAEVRRIAHRHGHRVSSGFLNWLEREVRLMVLDNCRLQRQPTLLAADAEAVRVYKKL